MAILVTDKKLKETEYGLYELIEKMTNEHTFLLSLNGATVANTETGEIYESIPELFDSLIGEYKEGASKAIEILGLNGKLQEVKLSKMMSGTVSSLMRKKLEEKIRLNTISSFEYLQYLLIAKGSMKTIKTLNTKTYEDFLIRNIKATKPNDVSWNDYGRFHDLCTLIFSDNALRYSNGKNISVKAMCELLGFTSSKKEYDLKLFIRRLISYGLLTSISSKSGVKFVINPKYYIKNTNMTHELYSLFEEDCSELIRDKDILRYYQICKREKDKGLAFFSVDRFEEETKNM